MTSRASVGEPHVINVGLIGIGVVGSAVLDFFARGPIELPIAAPRLGGPTAASVRLWSAARRSRQRANGANEERIAQAVTKDPSGRSRFYYDVDPNDPQGSSRTWSGPSWREVVGDEAVDVVVEVTGAPVAEAIIAQALWNGKCVVTANKAVLSRTGHDLVKLAQSRNTILSYEAAVGGGMPVVQTIASSVGGHVTAILAILNGTTNFILSRMRERTGSEAEAGAVYPAAVCAAIHGGLAEADPSADVLGDDARAKVSILAGQAFGVRLKPRDVYTRGIARRGMGERPEATPRSHYHACPGSDGPCAETCGGDDHLSTRPVFQLSDLHALEHLGYVPKLLAGAQQAPNGEHVVAWAQPAAVPKSHPLAGVDGSDNACLLEVESPTPDGETKPYTILLQGPGAGGPETASSVVADIEFCARQLAVARGTPSTECLSAPLYMYGSGAFARSQEYDGRPRLWREERLTCPFLLRFILGGRDQAQTRETLRDTLSKGGELALTELKVPAPDGYVYFQTEAVGIRRLEEGLETALHNLGARRVSMDVLYVPIIEGAKWSSEAEDAG